MVRGLHQRVHYHTHVRVDALSLCTTAGAAVSLALPRRIVGVGIDQVRKSKAIK